MTFDLETELQALRDADEAREREAACEREAAMDYWRHRYRFDLLDGLRAALGPGLYAAVGSPEPIIELSANCRHWNADAIRKGGAATFHARAAFVLDGIEFHLRTNAASPREWEVVEPAPSRAPSWSTTREAVLRLVLYHREHGRPYGPYDDDETEEELCETETD
jgi:hypothetical protein